MCVIEIERNGKCCDNNNWTQKLNERESEKGEDKIKIRRRLESIGSSDTCAPISDARRVFVA